MEIVFVTTNKGKMREAEEIGARYGITFVQNDCDVFEVQEDDLETVAVEAAKDVWPQVKKPMIVEDSGLFIEALGGFPGPYSAYAFKTIGLDGILRLMRGAKGREAVMKSAVAYTGGGALKTFIGETRGAISEEKRGGKGFGYDPIFIPVGHSKTFGEDPEMKNRVSHRAKSFTAFCEWAAGAQLPSEKTAKTGKTGT